MCPKKEKSKIQQIILKSFVFLACLFKTKEKKLSFLKKFYTRKYKEEELLKPLAVHIPYFIRVRSKIDSIVKNKRINFEFKRIVWGV